GRAGGPGRGLRRGGGRFHGAHLRHLGGEVTAVYLFGTPGVNAHLTRELEKAVRRGVRAVTYNFHVEFGAPGFESRRRKRGHQHSGQLGTHDVAGLDEGWMHAWPRAFLALGARLAGCASPPRMSPARGSGMFRTCIHRGSRDGVSPNPACCVPSFSVVFRRVCADLLALGSALEAPPGGAQRRSEKSARSSESRVSALLILPPPSRDTRRGALRLTRACRGDHASSTDSAGVGAGSPAPAGRVTGTALVAAVGCGSAQDGRQHRSLGAPRGSRSREGLPLRSAFCAGASGSLSDGASGGDSSAAALDTMD
ncbi:unnamed protein product, partial [Prorocentrum cordatum]